MSSKENNKNKGLENKPLSNAIQQTKEKLYDKVPLTLKQANILVYVSVAALVIVFILIILEATGVFKL